MTKITTIGLGLAKNVIQMHGVDNRGKAVVRKQLKRHAKSAVDGAQDPRINGEQQLFLVPEWT